MPIIAKGSETEYELIPSGNYQAVCYATWDVGFQRGEWQGKEIIAPKIIIAWELNELNSQNKRFIINKMFTLSLRKKSALKPMLESWRGMAFTKEQLKGFDVENLIGANCMLTIIHKQTSEGEDRARVGAVGSLPKGMLKIIAETSSEMPDWVVEIKKKSVGMEVVNDVHDDGEPVEDDEPLPF